MIKVLSIDGGGVRGIIPARVLVELERLGGKPIAEQFDLIAATSTGAILALGLSAPDADAVPRYTAEDLLDFHVARGPALVRGDLRARWRSRLSWRHRGRAHGLSGSLRELFGDLPFGRALSHLVVPTFDTESAQHVVFRSPEFSAQTSPLMRDVAHATSALPTRHAPLRLDLGARPRSLVHGGFAANNPALLAYSAARNLANPRERAVARAASTGSGAEGIILVSLGVGTRGPPRRGYEAHHTLRGWGWPPSPLQALGAMFDATGEAQDQLLSDLLSSARSGDRYWRIQAPLDGCSPDMHDADRAQIECLSDVAEDMVDRHAHHLADAAAALAQ